MDWSDPSQTDILARAVRRRSDSQLLPGVSLLSEGQQSVSRRSIDSGQAQCLIS